MKNSSCTRTLLGPVRPVGRIRPATGKPQPVRPPMDTGQTGLPILVVNICPPVFLAKLVCPKNILLDQNYLRAMINNASATYLF